jgi:hypothetical protein
MSVSAITIDRRSGLSPKAFKQEYYLKRKPVILTDATQAWPALQLLSPQWIRKNFPHKKIKVSGRQYTLFELIELLERADQDQPAPYPCTMLLKEWPEVEALAAPLPFAHARPNRLSHPSFLGEKFGSRAEIFLGGPGGDFPYAHMDYYHLHAWINMIYGRKEFWVFAVETDQDMYPQAPDYWRSSIPNVFEPDFNLFPRFRKVIPTRVELGPGETLFIPAGTWHSARSLTTTISIAFDQLNAQNMAAFTHDVATYRERRLPQWLRLALAAYLRVMGGGAGLLERSGLPLPW